jgi:hypothetical protein
MRVFLRKPKWLAYLLLLIILVQILPSVVRYYLGSREWTAYSSRYGFTIDYPGNWGVESYPGWFRGREGVVAIIGDSPGIIEAETTLTIYWRTSAEPSLMSAADWGYEVTAKEGGHSYSPLEQTSAGSKGNPALEQRLRYGSNEIGLSAYIVSNNAEYVLALRSQDGSDRLLKLFEHMLASFDLQSDLLT